MLLFYDGIYASNKTTLAVCVLVFSIIQFTLHQLGLTLKQ